MGLAEIIRCQQRRSHGPRNWPWIRNCRAVGHVSMSLAEISRYQQQSRELRKAPNKTVRMPRAAVEAKRRSFESQGCPVSHPRWPVSNPRETGSFEWPQFRIPDTPVSNPKPEWTQFRIPYDAVSNPKSAGSFESQAPAPVSNPRFTSFESHTSSFESHSTSSFES